MTQVEVTDSELSTSSRIIGDLIIEHLKPENRSFTGIKLEKTTLEDFYFGTWVGKMNPDKYSDTNIRSGAFTLKIDDDGMINGMLNMNPYEDFDANPYSGAHFYDSQTVVIKSCVPYPMNI